MMRAVRRPTRSLPRLVAVVLLGSLLPACTDEAPPVGAAESELSAEAWVVPQEDVVRFVEAHGGSMPGFVPVGRDPAAVVRVDWTPRELPADVRLQFVVLDPSGLDAATTLHVDPPYDQVSIGWDGRYEELATRYPWLEATGSTQDDYGNIESAMAVSFIPGTEGPRWIVARFPRNSPMGIARPSDVPVVGAFLTSDPVERIWWAEQLTGG